MWLVSCRRQGVLTQGPTPDRKCKLNISSFPILPHLSDCLIPVILCPFYCYCEWCRHGLGRGLLIYNMVWDGGQGVGIILQFLLFFSFFFFHLCFRPLFSHVLCPFFKWLQHDSCCLCFFVFYLFSLSMVPLTRIYYCKEIVVSVM